MMILLVGLPGSGKTTVAKKLAREQNELHLTLDEWVIPLFGELEADGKRDVLVGLMISLALQLLRIGINVVDFGCWARDERAALQRLTEREEAKFRLVYVPVDRATQLERIKRRWTGRPHETFAMTSIDVDSWRAMFEVPSAAELEGSTPPTPPSSWSSWLDWAQNRWPSLEHREVGAGRSSLLRRVWWDLR
jgi:predicted kinase